MDQLPPSQRGKYSAMVVTNTDTQGLALPTGNTGRQSYGCACTANERGVRVPQVQEGHATNRADYYRQPPRSCKSTAMHPVRKYGRLPIGSSIMTKKLLIRILVTVQCILGILMIVIFTR